MSHNQPCVVSPSLLVGHMVTKPGEHVHTSFSQRIFHLSNYFVVCAAIHRMFLGVIADIVRICMLGIIRIDVFRPTILRSNESVSM